MSYSLPEAGVFPSPVAAYSHWCENLERARQAFYASDSHYQREVALKFAFRCLSILRRIKKDARGN